jgi:hypothetical protein
MRKYSERYNNMMNSTCFNDVRLEGNLLGCWNGLTQTGWVEDATGIIVEELSLEPDLIFTKQEFLNAGYVMSSKTSACRYPDFW